jgi:large subunit ribosomal protein L21
MFAVFEAKGFQYLGSPGEKLKIPRLDSKIGEKVTFDKVLLVKNGDTKIGQPYIEGASITAKIVDHGRYKKIIVFKFKKRNRYKRTRGHRQTYTEIEIKDIVLGGRAESKKVSKKEEVKAEKESVAKAEIEKITAEKKKTTSKAKKKVTSAKKAKKTTKKTAKPKKTTTKKKKTTAKPKKTSAKAKKAKKSTSKTKKEKK